jgi:hypothetical protein
MEVRRPQKRDRYRHYKGNEYEIVGIARDCETTEEVVVYRACYTSPEFGKNQVWVRKLSDFTTTVEKDGKTLPRFEFLSNIYIERGQQMGKILKDASVAFFLALLICLCMNTLAVHNSLAMLHSKLTNLEQTVATLEIKLEMTGVRSYFLDAPNSKEVYIEQKAVWEEHMRWLEQLRNSK